MALEKREMDINIFKEGQLRIFVDASYYDEQNNGHIGIVVYAGEKRITTHLIKNIPSRSINYLEIQAVLVGYQLYKHSKIHTDSCHAISRIQKRKVNERLYLIDGKYNPADTLIRTGDAPETLDLTELVTKWNIEK